MQKTLDSLAALLNEFPTMSPELAHTLDLLTIGLIIARADGEMVFCNRMGSRLTGVQLSEEEAEQWSSEYGIYYGPSQAMMPPQELPLVRALSGETVTARRLFLRNASRPSGMWLDCAAQPLTGSDGQQSGAMVVFQPLPEDAQPAEKVAGIFTQRLDDLQEAIHPEEEDLVLRLLERTTDGIWDWNVLTGEDYFSPRWKRALGYAPDELENTVEVWKSLLHPEDLQKSYAAISKHFEQGTPYDITLRYLHKDGSIVWMRSRGEAIRDESGQCVRMLGSHTDLTPARRISDALEASEARYRMLNEELERKVEQRTARLNEANQELAEKNEALLQFTYIASHDLQEPLRKILSFGPLLEERIGPHMDEKSKIYLGFMLDGASRMRQLIQDLLQYSRADRPEQFTEPVSVEAALKVALLNLEAAIPCPEQQLTVHRPLPVVHCGKRHLAQILQNLLSNAAKYQQPDQALSITLSTEQTEAADILHITDNGIGIEEQYHERIFQVFQRLHPRHRYSGTGIGLAICRRLVTHYNGTITVSSTPDAGSTFTLTFPRPRNQP